MDLVFDFEKPTPTSSTAGLLSTYSLGEDVFYQLLEDLSEFGGIQQLDYDDFKVCYNGFVPKDIFYYCFTGNGIVMAGLLRDIWCMTKNKSFEAFKDDYYHQGVFYIVGAQTENYVERDLSGSVIWNKMKKMIESKIGKKEFKRRMESFKDEKKMPSAPMHANPTSIPNEVLRFDNCIYLDMNSAYGDGVREVFPELTTEFEKMYNERKQHPQNKKLFNYFVGFSVRQGYQGFFNHIVNRTYKILSKKIEEYLGKESDIVYANTDGFIIQNPLKMPKNENWLGGFKLEYAGTVYTYYGSESGWSGYFLLEYGNEQKGNLRLSMRQYVNLSKGETVKVKLGKNAEVLKWQRNEIKPIIQISQNMRKQLELNAEN